MCSWTRAIRIRSSSVIPTTSEIEDRVEYILDRQSGSLQEAYRPGGISIPVFKWASADNSYYQQTEIHKSTNKYDAFLNSGLKIQTLVYCFEIISRMLLRRNNFELNIHFQIHIQLI